MAFYDDDDMYDSDSYENESNENELEVVVEESKSYSKVGIAAGDSNYTVLSLDDVSERQRNAIATVSGVLSVTESEAAILLRHFDWHPNNANDQWFADEQKVRTTLGLLLQPDENRGPKEAERKEKSTCLICLDDHNIREMKALQYCNHLFCQDCWRNFIHTSINDDGAGCLNLRCPFRDPQCRAIVSEDMVFSLGLSEEDESKYRTYLVRSYVEENIRVKWCPARDCQYCVEVDFISNASQEVVCNCSYKFCWNCLEESHRPIDCGTVKKWVDEINDRDLFTKYWIRSHSKPCPKCKRPIEKDQGCMHMTCRPPCDFNFCWLCLDDWYNNRSGHHCNKYSPEAATSGKDDGNQFNSATHKGHVTKKSAKTSSDRLYFYLVRWKENEESEQKALSDLKRAREVQVKSLYDLRLTTISSCHLTGFKCVEDAWLQIAECRRILKWTYAYGYYLTPSGDLAKRKHEFFEFLQGEAENSLERLHQCAERELRHIVYTVLNANADTEIEKKALKDLEDVCIKLKELTKSTAYYFEKLIEAFENDLSEIKNT